MYPEVAPGLYGTRWSPAFFATTSGFNSPSPVLMATLMEGSGLILPVESSAATASQISAPDAVTELARGASTISVGGAVEGEMGAAARNNERSDSAMGLHVPSYDSPDFRKGRMTFVPME